MDVRFWLKKAAAEVWGVAKGEKNGGSGKKQKSTNKAEEGNNARGRENSRS